MKVYIIWQTMICGTDVNIQKIKMYKISQTLTNIILIPETGLTAYQIGVSFNKPYKP